MYLLKNLINIQAITRAALSYRRTKRLDLIPNNININSLIKYIHQNF